MYAELTLATAQDLSNGAILVTSRAPYLRRSGRWWRCLRHRRLTQKNLATGTTKNSRKCSLTRGRFAVVWASGVPSRFSALDFGFATEGSSRSGRMLRSAYLRQLMPQLSQRTFVASPFGAFHHVSDSRVRHAPQLFVLVSSPTTEPSSSDMSATATRSGSVLPEARAALILSFSSPNFALFNNNNKTWSRLLVSFEHRNETYFFQWP